ncbi:hypothetical protein H0H92_001360, partial [Tricholoma furcatifolium]
VSDLSIPASSAAASGTATIVVSTTDTPTDPQEHQDDYVFPSNLDYQPAVDSPLLELEAEAEHSSHPTPSNFEAGDSVPEEGEEESATARQDANIPEEGEEESATARQDANNT